MNDKLITWEQAVKWMRNNVDLQELVRHCYYDDPVEKAAERFSTSEEWRAIEMLLQPYLPGKVLDLGAGRGIASYAFAKAGCSVTAIEPDPSPLIGAEAIRALAKSTELVIQVLQESGETLPLNNGVFDIVFGRAVLHHSQDLVKLCNEASRVLKSGGVFIATREHVISTKGDLKVFLDAHPLHHLYGGENAYLLRDYKKAIENAGLTIKKTIGPFESVINFAPMSRQEYQSLLISRLAEVFGHKIAKFLAGTESIQRFYGWYLSWKLTTPGRHYSFLAIKK